MVRIRNANNPLNIEEITNRNNTKSNIKKQVNNNLRPAHLSPLKTYSERVNSMKQKQQQLELNLQTLLGKKIQKKAYIERYANVPNKNELRAMKLGNIALNRAISNVRYNLEKVTDKLSLLKSQMKQQQSKMNKDAKRKMAATRKNIMEQMHKSVRSKISKKTENERLRKSLKKMQKAKKLAIFNKLTK